MSWKIEDSKKRRPFSLPCLPLFAAALLLLWLPASAAFAEPEAVTAARKSVICIYGMGTDSETGAHLRWMGTGFAVGAAGTQADTFLTNRHVVTGNGRCDPASVQLWILSGNVDFFDDKTPTGDGALPCRVLCPADEYPDVAIVQTAKPLQDCPALPLLSARGVADGTEVYALGFSGAGNAVPEAVTVTRGTVQRHLIMRSAGDTCVLVHSAAIVPGFSGGPLINARGEAVAVNTYGFEADVTSSLFCAVYADYAMALLEGLEAPDAQQETLFSAP